MHSSWYHSFTFCGFEFCGLIYFAPSTFHAHRTPLTRLRPQIQRTAKILHPRLDIEPSHTWGNFQFLAIEAYAIVLHGEVHMAIIFYELHQHLPGIGVFDDVVEQLLCNAEQDDFCLLWQTIFKSKCLIVNN